MANNNEVTNDKTGVHPAPESKRTITDKTNRTLKLLSDCNDALVLVREESELLNSICALIVEKGGYPFAWVGYARTDEARTIEPVACSGDAETHVNYLKQAIISWGDGLRGTGPAGKTIRTGKAHLVRNLYEDVNFGPWRKEAEKRGFTSVLTLPLKWDASVKGMLGIYAPVEEAFDQEEIKLLERLADNLSFGIQSIRNNRNRQQAENLLALENQVYQLIAEDLSEEEFFSELLRRLERMLENSCCSLILFDAVNKGIELVAAPALGKDFIDSVMEMGVADGGNLPAATVLQQQVMVNDLASIPVPDNYQNLLMKHGIKAYYSVPLFGAGKDFLGSFTCYYRQPLSTEHSLKPVLEKISLILSNAIGSRMALAALRESQERFQLLSMATLDGIYDWNPKTGRIWVNDTFRKTFGPISGEGDSVDWKKEFIHPDDLDLTLGSLQERFRHRSKLWMREYRHLKKDGSYADVIDRGYIIFDREGRPARMIGVIIDVTARKQAEWAIKESETRYQALYDDSPSMFFTLAPDGSIISANKFGAQHLGYTVAELVDKSILDLCIPDDKKVVLDKIISCVNSPGKVYRCEIGIVHKYQDVVWVRATLRLIHYGEYDLSVLVTCEDISETRLLSEQLEHQAKHDYLTGLINRTEFERRLRRIINSESAGEEHALCYLDLDQFKVINDTCGHIAGDELIRQISDMLSNIVRKRDTLARLGGDEFAILMEHCTLTQATRVAKDLLKAVESFRFLWEGKRFSLGVSIGVVPIDVGQGSVNDILSVADAACYAAKDAGRNRMHVYQSDDDEFSRRRGEMQWVARINNALEGNCFCLAAQEISYIGKDVRHRGKHYELLVRMRGDNGEIIPPGAFLPAAERYNLSVKIDRWVVTTIFRWLTDNPAELDALELCSINLSGHTLGDNAFLKMLLHQFQSGSIPPGKICFEITETAAVANLRVAVQFIHELKSIGCLFSLDDFGTGLSSFNYLKNLPVDFLKIDGSFVREVLKDPIDLTMVRSINDLGKVMGKKTIAEFVENTEILAILKELGIDYAQGYAIGMPVLLPI